MQIQELNWVYLANNLSFMPVRLRTNEIYFNFRDYCSGFWGKLDVVFSAFIKPLTNNILWIEKVVSICLCFVLHRCYF